MNEIHMTDKELTERIFADLIRLPAEIRAVELDIVDLRSTLNAAKNDLENAELDARINAVIDGKNETARKQQADIAITNSSAVRNARTKIAATENELAAREVETKTLSKQWQGAMAMAELQAARLNLTAKYQSIPKRG
jgi:hypothetical protein